MNKHVPSLVNCSCDLYEESTSRRGSSCDGDSCYKEPAKNKIDCFHDKHKTQIYASVNENKNKFKKTMFQNFKYLVNNRMLKQKESKNSIKSSIKTYSITPQHYEPFSKKPLSCPYEECERAIAISAIKSHFIIEHKSVSTINICYGIRNSLDLYLQNIKYNRKFCIVLINILDDHANSTMYCPVLKSNKNAIQPIMILLGTRMSNLQLAQLYEELSDTEDSDDNEYDEGYSFSPTLDKIILWVACNVPTKSKYTLAVSTPCRTVRLKYYGLVSQMCDDYYKLCEKGRALILNASYISGMTENGKKHVSVDFIIHSCNDD